MIFFVISLLIGVGMEIKPEFGLLLRPLFWHALMVGWITQIIIGVSLWMFPGRSKTEDFRSQFLSWLIFGLLNIGLILRLVLEPFSNTDNHLVGIGIIASAVFQSTAAIGYFIEMWPRILSKEKQRKRRKKKKETQ
jgi:hypothetical protein